MKKLTVNIVEGGIALLDFNYEVEINESDIENFLAMFEDDPYEAIDNYCRSKTMLNPRVYNVEEFFPDRQIGMVCWDENNKELHNYYDNHDDLDWN